MKHKTTDEDFQYFVTKCREWIDRFSLQDWKIYFKHQKDDNDVLAAYSLNYIDKNITIYLNTHWLNPVEKEELDYCAFHEVAHILPSPLFAQCHILYREECDSQIHAMINKLWNVLKEVDDEILDD